MTVKHWGDSSFVSFPIYYPSGAAVTVRVIPGPSGFRVDDAGFAYREIEAIGFERSFATAADKARAKEGVEKDRRSLYVTADWEQLSRALSDVAMASWDVADRVFGKIAEQEQHDIEDYLRERLAHVFGSRLEDRHTIVGSSSNPWEVSAIVSEGRDQVVFQAVSSHANSVYRASTAFHDIAALPNPPKLVAVVKDKAALGTKLSILGQAGRVIQSDQSDDVYLRAAA
ncbi:MAG: hypothetical protein A4S16_01645 [Proteobacteria bacterium SG_bin6]|nr:MAG: hypothetical protein A4S16_01645 [Proteobacteria bacterium SG_bin6]